MNVPSRPVRTYSRRHSFRDAAGTASPSSERGGLFASSSRLHGAAEPPRKRRILYDSDTDTDRQDKRSATSKTHSSPSKPDSRSSSRIPERPTTPSSPVQEDSSETNRLQLQTDKGKGKAVNGGNVSRASSIATAFRDVSPSVSELSSSCPTTPKKPKDLSRIFEAASPRRAWSLRDSSQASPEKSGITKKMLSRSKTESSIDSSPRKETLQLTPKAKSFTVSQDMNASRRDDGPPSPSPKKGLSRNLSLSSVTSGAHNPLRTTSSNTRTYAGNSRSFLVALPAAALLNRNGQTGVKQNTVDEDDEDYLRDSYAELRRRYGIDNSEGVDAESGDTETAGEGLALYNPLFSITDLRSKGESRRFRDEVGYVFEGLEPSEALSVRRNSALDIISNLSDHDFWKKARAAGLIVDIWDRLREAGAGNGDKVLDVILCCFAALASEDPRDVPLLATKEDFVETIVQLMVSHAINDPLSSMPPDCQPMFNKAEALILDRLRHIMSAKTTIVHEGCQTSTRLFLSCLLASMSSLAFPHLNVVLDSACGDLASVCSRVAAYKSGLSIFADAPSSAASHRKLCLEHIYNCLTILDLYLIELEALDSAPSLSKTELRRRYRALPSGLVALIVIADIISRSDHSEALRSTANQCSELAFRILINLTNDDPTWTDAVVADPYTLPTTISLIMTSHRRLLEFGTAKKTTADETVQETSTSAMDRLCLALALLTNLLQERDNLAYSLQNTMYDPACEGHRTCLLGCRCANSTSAVTGLVNMYTSYLKDEDDELAPDFHFLRGHLAVLVGLILLQLYSPSASASHTPFSSPHSSQSSSSFPTSSAVNTIIDSLPGPADSHGRKQKLTTLIDNIDAFSRLYASLTSRVGASREDGDRAGDGSDDTVQRANRNSYDSDVVAGVAASLRALRDDLCRA